MKSLYAPAKIWMSADAFLKDFPQTKTALFMLLTDAYLSKGIEPGIVPTPLNVNTPDSNTLSSALAKVQQKSALAKFGIDQYEYARMINAYSDSIAYILDPTSPMSINIVPVTPDYKLFPDFPKPCDKPSGEKMLSSYTWRYPTIWNIRDTILIGTDKLKTTCKSPSKPLNTLCEERFYCASVYMNKMINFYLKYGFRYFEIRSPAVYLQFDEIYGERDISRIPPKTISYVVKGLPPPIPKEINWKTVDFWSAVFSDPTGTSILNAVARNMPVKLVTLATGWKDPNQKLTGIVRKETEEYIQYTFTYLWNKFNITIDRKSSILVEYDRNLGVGVTIHTIPHETAAWVEVLKGVGFVVAVMTLAAAAAAALAAAGIAGAPGSAAAAEAAALEGSIAAGTASGVTSVGMSSMALSGSAATGAALTGTAATIKASTTAIGSKASIWSTVLKAAPKIAPAVAKLGVGLWSASERAKIQEEMAKAGFTQDQIDSVPMGLTTDGHYVYQPETQAGILGGIDPKILMLVLAGAGVLALTFGKPVTKSGRKPRRKR